MDTRKCFLAAGLVSASGLTSAQTAYLERAQVLAAGAQIQTFRLPTKGTTGAIRYWDMTVELALDRQPVNLTLRGLQRR